MPARLRKSPLEPLAAVFIAVLLVHLLVGLMAWTLLPLLPALSLKPVWAMVAAEPRRWFSPAEFKYVKKAPAPPQAVPMLPLAPPIPAAPAAAVATSGMQVAQAAGVMAEVVGPPPPAAESVIPKPTNKSITLSPMPEKTEAAPGPQAAPITLMQVLKLEAEVQKAAAASADMDPVLWALEEALKTEWEAPPLQQVPVMQRDARLAITISRDGTILETSLSKSSGSAVMDQSIAKVRESLKKISTSLPSSFAKDRYTVEVNFHIE